MKTIKIVIAVWIVAALIAGVFGEVTVAGDLGATTANFLKIGVGARAMGMGGAFTSIADNASTVYWNPSGLRLIDQTQIEFSHQSWYQDVGVENLQVVFPSRRVSFGAGVTYLNYGAMQSYDEYGDPGEELSMYSLAFTVAAATDVTEDLAIGVSGKYIEQSFDVVRGRAFAGDIGLLMRYGGVRFGFAAANIGSKITYISQKEDLPAGIRFGLSFFQMDNRALLSFEGYSPFKGQLSFHQGFEFNLVDQLYARSGLIYHTGNETDIDALSYNLGLGIGYGTGHFDYTFMPADDYGSDAVHNFSISFSW